MTADGVSWAVVIVSAPATGGWFAVTVTGAVSPVGTTTRSTAVPPALLW